MFCSVKLDFSSLVHRREKMSRTTVKLVIATSILMTNIAMAKANAQEWKVTNLGDKSEKMSKKVTNSELKRKQRDDLLKLKRAVKYFEKNPSKTPDHMNPGKFKKLKGPILAGDISKISNEGPVVTLKDGSKKKLLSDLEMLSDVGDSLQKEKQFKNNKKSYSRIYKLLPAKYKKRIPSPLKLKDKTKLTAAYARLYKDISINLHDIIIGILRDNKDDNGQTVPAYYEANCANEQGDLANTSGVTADQSNRCNSSTYSSSGLYKNKSFPLKYKTTCIKDQAQRGTCVSFAINAAIEVHNYVENQKAINLSEQFTYFYGEISGGSSSGFSGRYGYGLNNSKTLGKLDSGNYKLQLESRWEYNPSFSIASNKSANEYASSCSGYSGPMCTNFAFQAEEDISGPFWNKTYTYTVPSRSSSTTWQVKDYTSIWSSIHKKNSLNEAILLVNDEVPVIVGFSVKQNFMDKAGSQNNGYVKWKSGESNLGGHAALLVGFVSNSDRPSGAPAAEEEGYFIMKNSWGTGSADCGYFYVDYKYLRKTASSLNYIDI